MTADPTRNANILKLIRTEAQRQPEHLLVDRSKSEPMPELPPGITLTDAEQKIFDWLLRTTYKRGTHGACDGVAFVRAARMIARAQEVDAKIESCGLAAKNPRTLKLESTAYVRQSRELWSQIGIALAAIGGTPIGRTRIGKQSFEGEQGSLWDDID